jgi:hypothetical protein
MGGAEDDREMRPLGSGWGALSRRTFLRRGTMTAAAVGVITTVPGLSSLLIGGSAEAPALETGAGEAEADAGALTEPLLAQVKDLHTGEISLLQGEREVVIRNPAVARSLYAAARR